MTVPVLVSNDIIGSAVFYGLYAVYYFFCFSVSALFFSDVDDQPGVRGACMDGVYMELTYLFNQDYGGAFDVATIQPVGN